MRALTEKIYVPTLAVRPAEMNALERIEAADRQRLLANVLLRPWVGSHHLERSIEVIQRATAGDNCILDFDEAVATEGGRPVFSELAALRNPDDGFSSWYDFLEDHPNFLPTIQVTEPISIERQLDHIQRLDREFAIRFYAENAGGAGEILSAITNRIEQQSFCAIFDFGQKGADILVQLSNANALCDALRRNCPGAVGVFSATTFPSDFEGLATQPIYERNFFDQLAANNRDVRLYYGDRGSARAQALGGGGGIPIPRIDYPTDREWSFFRERSTGNTDSPDAAQAAKKLAYERAAETAISSSVWASAFECWGSHEIVSTAIGNENIRSPATATAARINIHIARQSRYGTEFIAAPEEDWDD